MYEITPQSLVSVQKQIDKITAAGMSIDDMMVKIAKGPIQKRIRNAVDSRWQTEKGQGYSKYIDIRVRYGKSRFVMTIAPARNTKKGQFLLGGRSKQGWIYAKKRDSTTGKGSASMEIGASRGKGTGDYRKKTRIGKFKGKKTEIARIAQRVSGQVLRKEISKRTGLGPLGGGGVTSRRF